MPARSLVRDDIRHLSDKGAIRECAIKNDVLVLELNIDDIRSIKHELHFQSFSVLESVLSSSSRLSAYGPYKI